ncbi:MAG: HD domain-containing phosphohydrolase [Armatimonadota bacterium]
MLVGVIFVFAAGYGVWQQIQYKQQALIRIHAVQDKTAVVDTVIKLKGRSIQTLAFDYSYWTEMYDFVLNRDKKWGQGNLDSALTTFDASGCWVFNKAGVQVYSKAQSNRSVLKTLPLTREQIRSLFAKPGLRHFFVQTPAGVLELRGSTIHLSDDIRRLKPYAGAWFVGRLWNKGYVRELGRLSDANMTLSGTKEAPTAELQSDSSIRISRALNGIEGRPLAYLNLESDSTILGIQENSASNLAALMVLLAVILVGFLSLTLGGWVSYPLRELCTSLETHDPGLLARLRRDASEFGSLARMIDKSFAQESELLNEVSERQEAEAELETLNQQLEFRVLMRTAELQTSNENLAIEIQDRIQAESQIMEMNTVLQRRLDRLTALRHIDLAIASTLDLRKMVNVCLQHVTDQLGVHAAAVLRYHPAGDALHYVSWYGFRGKGPLRTSVPLGEGLPGRCAQAQESVLVSNLSKVRGVVKANPALRGEKYVFYLAIPLVVKEEVKGVLEIFHREEFVHDQEWLDYLAILSNQLAIAIDNAGLLNDLQRSNQELTQAYQSTIEGWSRVLDLRDRETQGHSVRVTAMTLKIAKSMGMSEEELVHVRHGALLHDIGKMGVPDAILLKPGKLTDDEWVIMRGHTNMALEMLSPVEYLRPALDIPYCHHEKWDGSGYPRGLKDEEIPLAARIFAIADVYDALASARPYRSAWPPDMVLNHIVEHSGTHFDPKLVEIFIKMMSDSGDHIHHPRKALEMSLYDPHADNPETPVSEPASESDLPLAA